MYFIIVFFLLLVLLLLFPLSQIKFFFIFNQNAMLFLYFGILFCYFLNYIKVEYTRILVKSSNRAALSFIDFLQSHKH